MRALWLQTWVDSSVTSAIQRRSVAGSDSLNSGESRSSWSPKMMRNRRMKE